MMTLPLRVYSTSGLFFFIFALNFLVTTFVSQPYNPPNQVETLLAFKNEFSICNNSVTSSWTKDPTSLFDGVVFDGETGSVTELHLGGACLSGSLKANSSLFRFHHLRYLDLSFNDITSPFLAEFGRLTNLEFLDLHHNGFTGEVPSSIQNLSRLTSLDLSINKLTGDFPLVHNLTELFSLHLSNNYFSGTIPSYLFTTPSLLDLDLHQNHFTGPLVIPSSNSSYALETLNLGNNNLFSGSILEPISNLVNLIYLDLSFLNITFPFNFTFLPFMSLEYLDISGNNVSRLNMSSDHTFSTTLTELHLSGCNIHEFPKGLKTLQYLQQLDISNNRLKGKVPEWLWNLPSLTAVRLSHNSINGFEGSRDVLLSSLLLALDFSSNAFQGSFPVIPRSLEFMSASNNDFTGDIPDALCDSKFLNVLDLSNNSFSGFIPGCFGESLQVLNLSSNNLKGEIPDMFYGSSVLTTIDVGHNQITGKLPESLRNCTGLEILNVESNHITDKFPFWLETLPDLKVIVLRSNRFYGSITYQLSIPQLRIIDISHNNFSGSLPQNYFVNWSEALISVPQVDQFPKYMVHLGYKLPNYFVRPEGGRKNTYLLDVGWPSYFSMHLRNKGVNREFEKIIETYTVIDFSWNRLGGKIPESIGLLKSLIVLDLSNNGFTGQIPSTLANLNQLESLDLSRNQLSGKIPHELSVLTFLEYIDMSHNKLTGKIPRSRQFEGQPESSFEGNIDLCGLPLQETCFKENETPSPILPEQEQVLNWKAVAIGYGPGVLFGIVIGQVIASYKPVLFFKLFPL